MTAALIFRHQLKTDRDRLLDALKSGKIVPIAIGDHLGQIAAVDNRYAPATDDRCTRRNWQPLR
jgi:hypothetical protein